LADGGVLAELMRDLPTLPNTVGIDLSKLRPEKRAHPKDHPTLAGEIFGVYYRLRVNGEDIKSKYYGKRHQNFEYHKSKYIAYRDRKK
jgi:hypothetical protein